MHLKLHFVYSQLWANICKLIAYNVFISAFHVCIEIIMNTWNHFQLSNIYLAIVRRSNQSILKEINPEYSLKGLMLKLKLLYFGHLMRRADSLEMTLMLGKIEGGRRRGSQRMRWLDGITNSMNMSLSKHWEIVKDRIICFVTVHGVAKSWLDMTQQLSNNKISVCARVCVCVCVCVCACSVMYKSL